MIAIFKNIEKLNFRKIRYCTKYAKKNVLSKLDCSIKVILNI